MNNEPPASFGHDPAYLEGEHAARNEKSRDDCPFCGPKGEAWLAGFNITREIMNNETNTPTRAKKEAEIRRYLNSSRRDWGHDAQAAGFLLESLDAERARADELERRLQEVEAAVELALGHLESANETISACDYRSLRLNSRSEIKRMSDNAALHANSGTPWIDDPPEGWTPEQLAQFARGVLYGEALLAGNLSNLKRTWARLRKQLPEAPQEQS